MVKKKIIIAKHCVMVYVSCKISKIIKVHQNMHPICHISSVCGTDAKFENAKL